jgi:tetratricopeptide (TPR) repeat protein
LSSPGALWQAAQEHVRARRLAAARENLEQLLRLQPVHVPARLLLASVHLADGSLPAALAETLAAARTLPDDAAVIARVAQALHALGETNAARAALAHPAIAASRDAPALLALAQVQQALGQHAQALALIERALALGFDSAELRYFRALQLQFHGRLAEAESAFAHCLQLRPGHGRAALALARLRGATPERTRPELLARQQDVLAQQQAAAAAGSEDEAAFEFARYTGFEALGRDEEAWAALARGNALMHARLPQRPAIAPSALVDAIIARATPEFLADAARAPARESGATPIFIVGMPRSGTTLLESLLARHPRIAAAGELGDFSKQWRQLAGVHGHAILDPAMLAAEIDFGALGQRYLAQTQWRAAERGFYIDKLPANFWLAGFIRKALPQARILHLVREPMELCFSNWRALFGRQPRLELRHGCAGRTARAVPATDAALARRPARRHPRCRLRRAGGRAGSDVARGAGPARSGLRPGLPARRRANRRDRHAEQRASARTAERSRAPRLAALRRPAGAAAKNARRILSVPRKKKRPACAGLLDHTQCRRDQPRNGFGSTAGAGAGSGQPSAPSAWPAALPGHLSLQLFTPSLSSSRSAQVWAATGATAAAGAGPASAPAQSIVYDSIHARP